jgi:hypothetical protein
MASAKAERNKVEAEVGGPKVELQGGSYAQPFVASGINVNITGLPSNSAKSTRASSSPAASSPSRGKISAPLEPTLFGHTLENGATPASRGENSATAASP